MSLARTCLILSIHVINGYLPNTQLSAIYDLYYSLNGDTWLQCQWNLTYLSLTDDLPTNYCGLYIDIIDNYTFHTITEIYIYNQASNLIGTIPDSINLLVDLEVFLINDQLGVYGSIPSSFCDSMLNVSCNALASAEGVNPCKKE